MQLHLPLGALCALLLQVATASAAPPAWCRTGERTPSFDKSLYTTTDPNEALSMIVGAYCHPDEETTAQAKQIAALRDTWSKRLRLVEADWPEVAEWAHYSNSTRGANTFDVHDRAAAWSTYSPLDQYASLSYERPDLADDAYVADAFGSKLTQLGRVGYVQVCLDHKDADYGVVFAAMCATDAAALDLDKISDEIRTDKTHDIADRMTARIMAYRTVTAMPAFLAYTKSLRDKDPAYATMFALGETAHQTWSSTDAKLIALVSDLDDARISGSRRASAGCMDRAHDAWKGVITALPAKKLAAIHEEPGKGFLPQVLGLIISQPNGYLATLALASCSKLEDSSDFLTRNAGAALMRWPGLRGPRTATQTAILAAGLKLDQRDATISFPSVDRPWITGDTNVENYAFGVVAEVKVEGDKATVTFAKQKIRQTRCVKGHYTNQISQIMSDGTVVYYYVCDKEVDETVEFPPSPPRKVLARYTAGLKPGMTVSLSDDAVVVAYPKNSTTPSLVTGEVVK